MAEVATPIFFELLDALRRQGLPIGVDHFVRVHVLLDRLGGARTPHELATLLCPIVATNRDQQEQFHATFEQWYGAFVADRVPEPEPEPVAHVTPGPAAPETGAARTAPRRRTTRAAILAGALLVALGAYWAAHRSASSSPIPGADTGRASAPTAIERAEPVAAPTSPTAGALATRPTGATSPPLAPTEGTSGSSVIGRHRDAATLLALLAPILLFAAAEVRHHRRRRLVLRRERRRKPPFVWPIHIPAVQNPYVRTLALSSSALTLRRRDAADELPRLDLDATIAATIAARGYPTFRFRTDTQPAEYLLLIERSTPRDHQAALFADLARALEQESVHITRYLFDGDPRVCHRDVGDAGLLIAEVRRKYPSHRLLLFGVGDGLIDPISGRLWPWVAPLLSWRDRALLTATPMKRWGMRERALASHFIVLPASTAALRELRDLFDAARPGARIAAADDGLDLDELLADADPGAIADALRRHLGHDLHQWVCACALYPELQWDLTLYLGSLVGDDGSVVTEENLLRLIRLPWFRSGVIPDRLRAVLVEELHPELARAARAGIITLLERNPPPSEAMAMSRYQLDLAMQRLAVNGQDRRRRRELIAAMEQAPRANPTQDYVLLRLLEKVPRTGAALLLPARLRRVLYRHGVPALGWTTAGRLAVTATAVVVIASVLRPPSGEASRATSDIAAAPAIPIDTTPPASMGQDTVAPSPTAMPGEALVARAYGAVVTEAARSAAAVRLAQIAGASDVFDLAAAHDVPAAFTRPGWTAAMAALQRLDTLVPDAARRGDRDTIVTAVRARYATDYARHWEAFVRGSRIRSFADLADAAGALRLLGSRSSPLVGALETVVAHTTGTDGAIAAAFAPVRGFASASRRSMSGGTQRYLDLLGSLASACSTAAAATSAASVSGVSEAARAAPPVVAAAASQGVATAMPSHLALRRLLSQPVDRAMQLSQAVLARLPAAPPTPKTEPVTAPEPAPVARIDVAPQSVELRDGDTVIVRVSLRDAQGAVISGRAVSLTSDDPTVASVDEQRGVVRGLRPGSTVVVVAAEGRVARVPVLVRFDVERFRRDVLDRAVRRFETLLASRDTASVRTLARAETSVEASRANELLEILRRRDNRLVVVGIAAPDSAAIRHEGDHIVAPFRVQLTWRDAFGRARDGRVTLRAEFRQSGGAGPWLLHAYRVVRVEG